LPTADEAVTANVADAPVEEEVLAGEEEASEEEAAAADAGPPPAWSIQPGGSLRFAADNGGSAISGSFRRWSGSITMNPDDPAGSRIAIEIDLASASLGDATQDQMLAGSEFFAVAANPVATFRSTDVEKTGASSYRARGTLSIKGASRPQAITFTLSGAGNRRAVSGSATVDRNAFGIGTGETAAGIAPNVRVDFAFDAVSGG
jgi:polyisoprenoid-binding protein YceI